MIDLMDSIWGNGAPRAKQRWETVFGAAIGWQVLYLVGRLSARKWLKLTEKPQDKITERDWGSKIVSICHACLAVSMATSLIGKLPKNNTAEIDWTSKAVDVLSITMGYYLWETYNSFQLGDSLLILRSVAGFLVFVVGSAPFAIQSALAFLIQELTTPFLVFHWLCNQMEMKESGIQLINAFLLVLVFFRVRIVFGISSSYEFFECRRSLQI
ncbi:hypothetical protein BCR33DRAFT_863 [Rhizoclosmatium globosum]|uniref:TLC domain-containing protein n=1 Tax=Rhizoclosmatium globosum TaxID=329046 RepID=A0A1Y2D2E3_9FUNG|nr:hypothetical protein BCR33DRAFT_863 [Rhizoclosmatium globosum]|eukprot:ORY53452.1 hypothetical protein BCR33DRAFT_863 [Rhizoclosmatium globosum]